MSIQEVIASLGVGKTLSEIIVFLEESSDDDIVELRLALEKALDNFNKHE